MSLMLPQEKHLIVDALFFVVSIPVDTKGENVQRFIEISWLYDDIIHVLVGFDISLYFITKRNMGYSKSTINIATP